MKKLSTNRVIFDDDFMFQMTDEEVQELSRSKNLTLNAGSGRGHNIKYNPHAFLEQGIYMLMTVLKGELATAQSKALIRIFKGMKDYISELISRRRVAQYMTGILFWIMENAARRFIIAELLQRMQGEKLQRLRRYRTEPPINN